jgi:hypothetical protein
VDTSFFHQRQHTSQLKRETTPAGEKPRVTHSVVGCRIVGVWLRVETVSQSQARTVVVLQWKKLDFKRMRLSGEKRAYGHFLQVFSPRNLKIFLIGILI